MKVRSILLVSAAFCFSALAQHEPPPGPYIGHQLVRVSVKDGEQRDRVLNIATTAWNCTPGLVNLDLQVTAAQLAEIRGLGLEPVVVIPDVQAFLDTAQAENEAARVQRDAAWFGAFKTLAEIHARLDYYAATYPGIVTTFVAGQTLEGRPIKGIRITGPDQPGNPRATRPAILYNACQHAREWATPMTAMWIADRLIENYGTDARLTAYADQLEVIIIPVVNADGYVHTWNAGNRLWRKNRRPNAGGSFGVDTNRNWGFGWGGEGASTDPASDTYRGTGPFSEPETQVMRDFMTANPRLKAHIDFHSYSQLILTPWGNVVTPPVERPIFVRVEGAMHDAVMGVHGRFYEAGPIYTTIYPASGGAVDWCYGDRGLLSATIEVRDTGGYGFVMPVAEIIPNAEENMEAALALADFAAMPLVIAPVGAAPLEIVTGSSLRVAVRPGTEAIAGLPQLYTRTNGGAWVTSAMAASGGIEYAATFAGGACGGTVDYYVEATTPSGRIVRYPSGGAAAPINAMSIERFVMFSDDMEIDRGWIAGAPGDTATIGQWSRCDPEATAAQPGDDHTPGAGTLAWITDCRAGTGVGSFDVDGGTTTLTSPRFSVFPRRTMAISEARVSFWRWYSNNQGSNPNNDVMRFFISNDDGQTWAHVYHITTSPGQWTYHQFDLGLFVTLTDQMRMRFVAEDLGGGSIIEAGIDDVMVEVFGCAADADVNCDFALDGFDVESQERAVGGDLSDYCKPDPDFNGDFALDGFDVYDVEVAVGGG